MRLLIVFVLSLFGLAPFALAEESGCTHSYKNSAPKDFPPLQLDDEDIPSNSNYDLYAEAVFRGIRFSFGNGFAQYSIIAEDAKTGEVLTQVSTDGNPENLTLEYKGHTVNCYLPQDEDAEQ